jgi:solute carrier family 50 protein (sugar transporter)
MVAKIVQNGLQVAGPIFFLGMQGSAVKTALKILEEQSVQQLSPLPFLSLLVNCIVWSLYGLLKSDNTVLVPNAIGILAGSICVLSYERYSQINSTKLYFAGLLVVLYTIKCFFAGDFTSIGLVGCALAVLVSGSPLATIRTVIRDKSTAALPFLSSMFTWLNACSWTLYGIIVANDPMVYYLVFAIYRYIRQLTILLYLKDLWTQFDGARVSIFSDDVVWNVWIST